MSPVRSESDERNTDTPKTLCEMANHLGCVNSVRWSIDGKWLASGGDDAIVMIWQIKYQGLAKSSFGGTTHEQWGCVHMLRGHNGDILGLSWSLDQKYLASCSIDNTIVVWNAKELPQKLSVISGHKGLVKGITWDPVGKYLASQSDDRSLRIWRTGDWKEVKQVTEPFKQCGGTTHVLRLSWSPDGKFVVSAHALNNDGPTAQIIERGDWKTGMDFVGHRKAVEVVSFNPHLFLKSGGGDNHGCVALGSRDRSLSVWLTSLKRPLVVIHDLFNDSILDLSWSADGYELLVCSTDGSVAYFGFSEKELGVPLSKQAFDELYVTTYGVKRASSKTSLNASAILIEDPEMLKLHAVGGSKGDIVAMKPTTKKESEALPMEQSSSIISSSAKEASVTQQKESRTKDGRRRITPITLTSQPSSLSGTPLPFTSFSPQRSISGDISKQGSSGVTSTPLKTEISLPINSPPPKPISFEPLSPKKPLEPIIISTKVVSSPSKSKSSSKRQLDSSSELALPKAKKIKKSKASELGTATSSSSKPGTPQKTTHLHSLVKQTSVVVLPAAEEQDTISLQVSSGNTKSEPLFIELNNNTSLSKCTICCRKGGDILWTATTPSIGLLLSANQFITCIAYKDRSMLVYSSQSGRILLARFYLPSLAHSLETKDHYVMTVTVNGKLSVWDIRNMQVVLKDVDFGHLLESGGKKQLQLQNCFLTKNGIPILSTTSGCFMYHDDMSVWVEASSQSEHSEIQRPEFNLSTSIEELTPLSQIQKPSSRKDSVGEMLSQLSSSSSAGQSQSSTLSYLESQISRSICLHSPFEYQHWTKVYVEYLVKENMEERLREFCSGFMSSVGQGRMVLGFQRKMLLKNFLVSIASNAKLQRLYCELRDSLDGAGV